MNVKGEAGSLHTKRMLFLISGSTGRKSTFVLFVVSKGREVNRLVPHYKTAEAQLKTATVNAGRPVAGETSSGADALVTFIL